MSQIECVKDACMVLDLELIANPKDLTSNDATEILTLFTELLTEEDAPVNDLIKAKNLILFEVLRNESKISGNIHRFNFDIKGQCKFCGGAGLLPILEIGVIPKMDKCTDCLGTGLQHKQCPRCYANGYIHGQVCRVCNTNKKVSTGTNQSCGRCGGTRYLDRKVNTGRLLSHSKCTVCKGIGSIIGK